MFVGMVSEVSDQQPENAPAPTVFAPRGRVMDLSETHELQRLDGIIGRSRGKLRDVSAAHP